jgi:menaquinone-dependent protoporphyrinogen IX oxidase
MFNYARFHRTVEQKIRKSQLALGKTPNAFFKVNHQIGHCTLQPFLHKKTLEPAALGRYLPVREPGENGW